MSIRTMSLVWDLELPDSDKIVLLALADCANDEGHCWPSVASLTRKCSKSERTIQGCIKRLVDDGHLTRREVIGKGCNYTVHPRKDCPPAETTPRQGAARSPAAAADKPSRTTNSEAKASVTRVIDHWNEKSARSGIPAVRVLNHSRTQMLTARLKEHGEAAMLEAVDNVHASMFCRGLRGDGRKADINLILQPKTLPRVLEGFYGQDDAPSARVDMSPAQYRERAEFYDRFGKPDDAARCRAKAAELEQRQAA